MSAIEPTPETDDIFDAYARCACGTACIRAKMQQIERERDSAKTLNRSLLYQLEAQAVQIETLRKTLIESEAYQAGLVADFEALRQAMREAAAVVAQIPVAYDHRFFRAGQWANATLAQLQPHLCS